MGRIEDALKRAGRGTVLQWYEEADASGPSTHAPDITVEDYPAEAISRFEQAKDTQRRVQEHRPRRETTPKPSESLAPTVAVPLKSTFGLVTDRDTPRACTEQYRRLGAALEGARAEQASRTIMVSSAVPGEGKTLTAINLALTLAESANGRVLLVDGDLHRPTVDKVLGLQPSAGLGEVLSQETCVLPIVQVGTHLSVLPAWGTSPGHFGGLTTAGMRRLIDQVSLDFQWVVIDTPPAVVMSDAKIVAAVADGVILVVQAGATDYKAAEAAVEEIGRERLLGVVLNQVTDDDTPSGDYYQQYYSSPSRADR
jgi:capsular exopolysaccharide synthesis family protein